MVALPLATAIGSIALECTNSVGVALDCCGRRRNHPPVGKGEPHRAIREPFGLPAAFVQAMVVVGAHQQQVAELVGSATSAMVEVMDLLARSMTAARHLAGAVAQLDEPPQPATRARQAKAE